MRNFIAKQKMRFFVGFAFVGVVISFANFLMLLNLNYGFIDMYSTALLAVVLSITVWGVGYVYYRSGLWNAENTMQSKELNAFWKELDSKIDLLLKETKK